jgi:hypothetical protein
LAQKIFLSENRFPARGALIPPQIGAAKDPPFASTGVFDRIATPMQEKLARAGKICAPRHGAGAAIN